MKLHTPTLAVLVLALTSAGCSMGPAMPDAQTPAVDSARLAAVLAAQPDETRARYAARHPSETLAFFELAPGMTVVEALPGGGWYSKILLDYLGADGQLIGADYAHSMWSRFGFFDDAMIEKKKTWATDWPAQAQDWRSESSAPVTAFVFNELPAAMHGSADAVLFIRALHNLARFNDDGAYLDAALAEAYTVLKPGGLVGIVQHAAREDASDAFASGARGYLKQSFVIERMRAAGFDYLDSSDINANANDRPGADDIVWRLPPSLSGSRDNPEQMAKMQAIGESNRMTLKFRKPL